jgi:hypothetical protein
VVVVVVVDVVDVVDVVVVSNGSVSIVVVISDSLRARTTNFNTRQGVAAKIIKTIKEMQMIATQRRCHRLCGLLFSVIPSLCTWLSYILCFTSKLN